MVFAIAFTCLFWLVVSGVLLYRHKSRWGWYVLALPPVFVAALYGVATVDEGFSIVLIIGLHLVMAPRLIWEEVLSRKDDDE